MKDLSLYKYDLPKELIAKHPKSPRDHSRLLVVDRKSGNFSEMFFYELGDFLDSGDSLVFNDTKVLPARLLGKRESGGKTEILLLEEIEDSIWHALAKPSRKLKPGAMIFFSKSFSARVLQVLEDGIVRLQFLYPKSFSESLQEHGEMPLPPYIERKESNKSDKIDYQTVFAKNLGSAAAPTAGLHFTDNLLDKFKQKKVDTAFITLHVGLGTFRPVVSSDIRDHKMHKERYFITDDAAYFLNQRNVNKRQICVGTTCCRTLEAASNENGKIQPGIGETDIFIYPGYKFKYVSSLLTNFHLPGSTLLMLVSAFAGYELIMEAYKKAVLDRYRFFSYGDAMLIL